MHTDLNQFRPETAQTHVTNQTAVSMPVAGGGDKARVTLQGFLNVMDRFRTIAQVSGATSSVGETLKQEAGATNTSQIEARKLFFKAIIIEFIYGALGIFVLTGILGFGYFSGRVEKEGGWSFVIHDLIGGNNFLHFMAQLISLITGVVGLVSLNDNDGRNEIVLVVPVLIALSNLLVGASNTKQAAKDQGIETSQLQTLNRQNEFSNVRQTSLPRMHNAERDGNEMVSGSSSLVANPSDTLRPNAFRSGSPHMFHFPDSQEDDGFAKRPAQHVVNVNNNDDDEEERNQPRHS